MTRHTADFVAALQTGRAHRPPSHSTMATRRKRSPSSDIAAGSKRMMLREEQLPSDICTYWPVNPAFDPKRVLLRRMFFINEDKTKYVSVGFYPARDY